MKTLPNFLVVGAAKSGTTTLFYLLKEQPEVFIPSIKECRFFSQMPTNFKGGKAAKFQNKGPRTLEEYAGLFANEETKIKGDISNDYFFYYEKTIPFIKKIYDHENLPYPRIIIVLREPVSRVISMYNHTVRLKSTALDFSTSFEQSELMANKGYSWQFNLKQVGMSFLPTKSYLDNFDDVLILFTEDLNSPAKLDQIKQFIGLSMPLCAINIKANENHYKVSRHLYINFLISQVNGNKFVKLLVLFLKKLGFSRSHFSYFFRTASNFINSKEKQFSTESATIDELRKFYKEDVNALTNLIGRKFDKWA